jgi:hypothetical protein
MNRRALLYCAALFTTLFVSSATFVSAQTASVVIGSGAIAASLGETRLTATIGQSAIGLTAATSTAASQGFWYSRTPAPTSLAQEDLESSSSLSLTSAPNPFSRSTTLSFTVQERGHVSLVLYNTAGQQVMTVLDGDRDAGPVSEQVDLSGLPSGSYTAAIRIGDRRGTTTLILVD